MMRAFWKHEEPTITEAENNTVRILDTSTDPVPRNRINSSRDTEPIRYVIVGDKVEAFTPRTCYKGILPDGRDYYPYYDFTLNDATPNDLHHYIDKLFQQLRSNLQ